MKNNIKKSITFKIFRITSMLLIISTVCIYLILYFLLPSFYYKYKKNSIETGLNKLVNTVSTLSVKDAKKYLDDFNIKYTVSLTIQDNEGNLVYLPFNVAAISSGSSTSPLNLSSSLTIAPPSNIITEGKIAVTGTNGLSSTYMVSKEVKFLNDDEIYTMNVVVPLQPIDEASKVLLNLVPLISVVILIVSVAGAFIYSKFITKPLLEINNTAKSLAALNFEKNCIINRDDEIGEIALSLNELASNLQHTMSELKSTNLKLMNDIEKERELEKRRREFTATISHELKTPITIIKGQLEGMLGNIGIYKDRDKYMNRSLVVLQDMESMVREILEISKLESHGFKPQCNTINLSYLIRDCVENLSYLSKEKDIDLYSDVTEDIYIDADEKLIKKAISNIINNAITHSERNQKVFIQLTSSKEGRILKVENYGAHIDETEFEKLFNPFYRIEKSRNRSTGGSGLGLYIVKMILEAHGLPYKITNTDLGVCFKVNFSRSN